MVWPFSSSSNSNASPGDPFSKLDPALRQLLDRETTTESDTPPQQQPTSVAQTNPTPTPDQPSQFNQPESSQPSPTAPTLFPDGRYAHLWKNYRSQSAIEAEHKSDQEQIADVLTTWKKRNSSISKAALENCAAINMELDACWRSPSLSQRVTLCRTESRALNRCVDMNQRFLKTLGYLSSLDRTPQEEEAIQMHADRLYVRMLEKEKEMEVAKKEGRLVDGDVMGDGSSTRPAELQSLTKHGKKQLEDRLKGLSPAERELEERAFAAEIKAGVQTMEQVEKYRSEARQARAERIESGKATSSDRLRSVLGW